MKFSLSWLFEFLETNATTAEISDKLTSIGLEVEEVIDNTHLSSFVVVQIVEVLTHPNADRLKICKVNNGKEILQIVCGADNVKTNMKTVLASIGSILPTSSTTITSTKIRGVLSNGMLCSEDELGLSCEKNVGIIELSDDYQIGESFFSCDTVIDINITPNRGDCLSVYGIARDLAATGIGKLKIIETNKRIPNSTSSPITLEVTDGESFIACRYISGIKNVESPKWLKDKLRSIGLRSISTIVDVTNYIMISFGKPLHAYDADKIGNKLIVQKVTEQKEFIGLNGKCYLLNQGAGIIADGKNIHAIAGIIGAECSQCSPSTKNIFLESAWFNPISIANTSRSIGLSTESAYRFERFVDPEFVISGLDIATEMILNICGGIASDVVFAGNLPKLQNTICFDYKKVGELGAVDISSEEILNILTKLGFVVKKGNDFWNVLTPSWRSDIKIADDLIEEVIRIYGYEKIKEIALHICDAQAQSTIQDKLRILMSSRGMNEVLTWSFMDEKKAEEFGYFNKRFLIANPLNNNLNIMRPTIIPNLLQVTKNNITRNIDDLAVFEIGPVYNESFILDEQQFIISGIRSGQNLPRNLYKTDRKVDVFDVKADFMSVLHFFNIDYISISECNIPYYHPGKSATVYLNNIILGYFGELHPNIKNSYEFKQDIMCFEIMLNGIDKLPVKNKQYIGYQYQNAKRDFAFLVSKDTAIGSIINSIKSCNLSIITEVLVFDVYEKINDYPNKKSVALSVTFHSPDYTLIEDEIKKAFETIIDAVYKSTGGKLRPCN